MAGKKKQKNSRTVRLIVGLILIAAAIAAAVGGVFYYRSQKAAEEAAPDASGYEELMKSYYSAIVSGDGKKMAQLMAPPEYWNYYMETYDKSETDVEDALKEGCAATYSGWQNTYGTDVKVSYQIAGMSEQGQDGLNEWNANMEEMLGNDGADMTESVLLEVKKQFSSSAAVCSVVRAGSALSSGAAAKAGTLRTENSMAAERARPISFFFMVSS